MAQSKTSLRLLVATAVLALIPLGGWWSWRRSGPLSSEATVLVPKGTTVDQLADRLEKQGVIRSATLFKLWARQRRLQLIRGEYTFSPRASMADVAGKLRRGEIHFTNIAITPAMTAWSVQKRLQAFVPEDAFWTLWKSPRLAAAAGFPEAQSLEGLVAPATYRLHHAMEPEEILLSMVEAFKTQVRPKLEGGVLPPYETLILASFAEKETNLREELPKVTGVYYHRLKIGMRMQCDPTCLYARWHSGDLRVTAPNGEDLHRSSPYNTYLHAGLTPTPIAIPSTHAIDAAREPEITENLYFVATGHGGHNFAPDLRQHNRNVTTYRKAISGQKNAAPKSAAKEAPKGRQKSNKRNGRKR